VRNISVSLPASPPRPRGAWGVADQERRVAAAAKHHHSLNAAMSHNFDFTVVTEPKGEAAARVYVLAVPSEPIPHDELAAYRISGQIVGPSCRYSSTLPATIPLKHRGLTPWGDRMAVAAETILPDPCYWSPDLPFLYRAVGELTPGPRTSPSASESSALAIAFNEPFGTRSLSVVRRRIMLNGKTWVPRIAHQRGIVEGVPLLEWRQADMTLFTHRPDEALLREADEAGVWIVAEIADTGPTALTEIMRLNRHPSVAAAVFATPEPLSEAYRAAAPNLLLARTGDDGPGDMVDAAHLLLATASSAGQASVRTSTRPILAAQPLTEPTTPRLAREACDRLQADLAGKYDAAGYIV
jgi:hypothetical protein